MIAARQCLTRRQGNDETQARLAPGTQCVVRLDRLQLVCIENPRPALRDIPGFVRGCSRRIKRRPRTTFQPYGRAQWFWSEKSGMKFAIECEPLHPWIAPYRLTLIADDRSGLGPREVFRIIELLPKFKLTTLELALDFTEQR